MEIEDIETRRGKAFWVLGASLAASYRLWLSRLRGWRTSDFCFIRLGETGLQKIDPYRALMYPRAQADSTERERGQVIATSTSETRNARRIGLVAFPQVFSKPFYLVHPPLLSLTADKRTTNASRSKKGKQVSTASAPHLFFSPILCFVLAAESEDRSYQMVQTRLELR